MGTPLEREPKGESSRRYFIPVGVCRVGTALAGREHIPVAHSSAAGRLLWQWSPKDSEAFTALRKQAIILP